jgi:hypothetical protein
MPTVYIERSPFERGGMAGVWHVECNADDEVLWAPASFAHTQSHRPGAFDPLTVRI